MLIDKGKIHIYISVVFKSANLFRQNGCENCEPIMRMKNNQDRVMECTTSNFDG